MNCQTCRELIQRHLDERDGADVPELARHLTACADCAALHGAVVRLSGGLRLLAPPRPPDGFGDRLLAAALADRRRAKREKQAHVAAFVLAASLLLAIGAALGWTAWLNSRGTDQQTAPIVNRDPLPEPGPEKPPAPASASVRASVGEAGDAIAALTTRAADETVGQSRLLVPLVKGPTLDDVDMPPLEPAKPFLDAGQGVSVGLEPVTTSARRAIDLFRRELPGVDRLSKPDS